MCLFVCCCILLNLGLLSRHWRRVRQEPKVDSAQPHSTVVKYSHTPTQIAINIASYHKPYRRYNQLENLQLSPFKQLESSPIIRHDFFLSLSSSSLLKFHFRVGDATHTSTRYHHDTHSQIRRTLCTRCDAKWWWR